MASSNPVVLVTGGARGIGFACCQSFYNVGFNVAITDMDADAAQASALELDPTGKRTFAVELNVAKTESANGAFAQVGERFGRIDVLVNNAGNFRQARSATYTDEDWEYVTGVHLDGAFRCSRAAYPFLKESPQSAIVSISSIMARIGLPKRLSYAVSKSGIEALTRVLAVEWALDGIRVNAVAPGFTHTRSHEELLGKGLTTNEKLLDAIPIKRLADPMEIGNVVQFLASPTASYITGQTVIVDGGASIDIRI
ncbi:MAG TPA: SDR family NAD(P)-dependent oxidoreductase [Candidatus Paceibacterota bacterium]|nr:SDR family NAD(P)-dependent oxidoreductase [Candidatus Paceibacterota bacterium]